MKKFSTAGDLMHWLEGKGIDLSSWGIEGAKSVQNLWDEYLNEEVFFEENPPTRVVQVVQVLIRRGDRVLLEVEQVMGNSFHRSRNQPPSEKMKAGENYIAAAVRCLNEELGLQRKDIAFIGSGYEKVESVTESPSYPGLQTRYTFHSIEAVAKGLPEEDFWRDNVAAGMGDPVKRHLWAWHVRA